MNEFMQRYELVISTLSPVHIGCGEDYEPTNYVIDGDMLYSFDATSLTDILDKEKRSALLEIVERNNDGAVALKKIQQFMYGLRKALQQTGKAQPVAKDVAAFYRKRIGQVAQKEVSGRELVNKLEIERTAFHAIFGTPYLPGSSLKGAIRTALLDAVNLETKSISHDTLGLSQVIKNFNCMIEENHVDGKFRGWVLKRDVKLNFYRSQLKAVEKKIKDSALSPQKMLFRALDEKQNIAFERDPLRLLKVADASVCAGVLPPTQIQFCINRKRNGKLSVAQSRGLYSLLETINPFQSGVFRGGVVVHNQTGIKGYCSKTPELQWSMSEVVNMCNAYYLPKLEADVLALKRQHNDNQWAVAMSQLLGNKLRDRLSAQENPTLMLLRVGKHSGADSITLEKGRAIKIMLNEVHVNENGKEQKQRLWVFDDSPRTIWIAADSLEGANESAPYGWLLVSIGEMDSSIASDLNGYYENRFSNTLDKIHISQQKKEMAAQEVAAAQAEAERRATLSPALREVEEFIATAKRRVEQLRGKKESLNADFHNRARKLAVSALENDAWTADEKRAVADAVALWLPQVVSGIDKDQLKKLKLGALRGNT